MSLAMLEIIDETHRCPSIKTLKRILKGHLKTLGLQQRVTVIICNDATIAKLNLEHRDENHATDVLSYPMHEPTDLNMPTVEHLGDIFISLDTAQRQAKADVLSELLTLAAHGITHLRGFDHPTEEAWIPFHEAQQQVLKLYGNPTKP
jgi:probable rRNA maturation factor